MLRSVSIFVAALLVPALAIAAPPGKPDVTVMTQNQYLGADLTPIITAGDPEAYNMAVLEALFTVAGNNIPERVHALAAAIVDKDAHLVGLQEMFRFDCVESGSIPGACLLLDGAMNDHLELTMDALDALGADYHVAATVNNLTIPDADFNPPGLPWLPGLPLYLDLDAVPDVFIQVLDRDIILRRGDVTADPVPFPCAKVSVDGCNFDFIGSAELLGRTINIQRGFVGVDATVGGQEYRFVNTHLEVQHPEPTQDAPLVQAIQASQLIGTMTFFPPAGDSKLIVVGDINSDPLHPVFMTSYGFPAYPPYQQLAMGVDFMGFPLSLPFTDIWPMRPGKSPGNTCCEAADLSNDDSMHDERIDVIFTIPAPARVKANVLNNGPEDKTPSGLWPSDHASMVGRLFF